MILKLSDLQRSLDQSLHTTHGQSRIFIIVARYCAKAGKLSYPSLLPAIQDNETDDVVWDAEYLDFRSDFMSRGLSLRLVGNLLGSWWNYTYWSATLKVVELGMDARARFVKVGLWIHGLSQGGLAGAVDQMAGLK